MWAGRVLVHNHLFNYSQHLQVLLGLTQQCYKYILELFVMNNDKKGHHKQHLV